MRAETEASRTSEGTRALKAKKGSVLGLPHQQLRVSWTSLTVQHVHSCLIYPEAHAQPLSHCIQGRMAPGTLTLHRSKYTHMVLQHFSLATDLSPDHAGFELFMSLSSTN